RLADGAGGIAGRQGAAGNAAPHLSSAALLERAICIVAWARAPLTPGPSPSRGEGCAGADKPEAPLLPLREKVAGAKRRSDEGCAMPAALAGVDQSLTPCRDSSRSIPRTL